MKISIKTLKGDMFPIEAAETDTVLNLKAKISDLKSDSPVDRQKLIHSGKVLKDEQTVAELGITEADFIVCMLTKEVAKKAAPTPAPAAPAPIQAAPATPVAPPAPVVAPGAPVQAPQPPQAVAQTPASPDLSAQFVTPDALAALTGMGFPESESRAALIAAMGNPDLAYEFLLTGIPERARAPAARMPVASPAAPAAAPQAGGIEQLRRHPQFNMLKNLIQQNPAQLPQVLDLIGQQDPALLAAIHANNDAFIAMMNEPITDTPAPAAPVAAPALGGGLPMGGMGADPAQIVQMLGSLPPAQRAQFAQSMGMTPAQLEGFMQMMSSIPPEELQQMLAGGMGGAGGHAGHGGQNVIRLTEEEMAAVNRLMGLGFSQQEAAQAYLACDKNEELAANFLFEGGFMDDGEDGGFGGHDDDMYH